MADEKSKKEKPEGPLKAPSGFRDRFRRSEGSEGSGDKVSTHKKLTIGIVAAVTFLLLIAVGAWAYDSSQEEQIADGVRVGGVAVGGRSSDDARAVIENKVVAPLKRPVTVTFGDQSFTLTSKQFKQKADIDGMVAAAQQASRDAGLPSRVWREVTGGEVNVNLPPQVSYDQDSIDRFVRDVAEKVDRDPQDATVVASGDSLAPSPGENGIAVRQGDLSRLVAQKVEDPVGARSVEAKVDQTKPEVTRKQLASQYPTYLTLDRANYTLRFFRNLKLEKTYTVAVGQVGLETPAGLYHIQDKQVDPTWNVPNSAWAGSLAGQSIPPGPGNPLVARWMGIFDGAGIHGTYETSSLGTAASHGCVRMGVDDVIDLYDRVDVGTPIYIG